MALQVYNPSAWLEDKEENMQAPLLSPHPLLLLPSEESKTTDNKALVVYQPPRVATATPRYGLIICTLGFCDVLRLYRMQASLQAQSRLNDTDTLVTPCIWDVRNSIIIIYLIVVDY